MPSVTKREKVLVSGANGYIAIWVIRTLLERGYAVRGTVRSQEKGQYLAEKFKSFGDKLELAIVRDIAEDGAFDEAVKGVDAIAHTASPFFLNAQDPQELFKPAIRGTLGILQSAIKNGSGIKRVIVLSSCASVAELSLATSKIFDENDWNNESIKEVEALGVNAPGSAKYRASKTLADKEAWKFYEGVKGKVSWDLTVLCPPFVFGPTIHDVKSPEDLNTSSKQFYTAVLQEGGYSNEALSTQGSAYIDVRDLAEAHALAFEKEAAGNERIIVAAAPYVWQDFVDVANALTPSPMPGRKFVTGTPGAGRTATPPVRYNTAKAAQILGLKYRTKEEMTKDSLVDFQERGW